MSRNEAEFSGDRLRLARAFRGLTQTELAEKIAWSPARISLAERGQVTPGPSVIEAVSEITGFEPAFFSSTVDDQLREEACNFRRKRSAIKREKERILARGTLLVELVHYLRGRVSLPAYSLPSMPVSNLEEAENAAAHCRDTLVHDSSAPISRIGRVIENAGVVWVKVDAETETIDAFSHPGEVSIIFANTAKQSTSRTVFDLAHELGHLVMHDGYEGPLDEREEQAHRFAGAFLLPRNAFRREFPRGEYLDWPALFAMKRRWRTSVAAIVHRAYDLKLLKATQYRRAFQHLYAHGWHRAEPDEPEAEVPELLGLALDVLDRELGERPQSVAEALHWDFETLQEVTGLPLESAASAKPPDIGSYRQSKKQEGKS